MFDWRSVPILTPPPVGDEGETMEGSTGFPAGANETLFLGWGADAVESAVQLAVRAGTSSELWVVSSVAVGASGSATWTLRKNGVDTAVVATITGAGVRVGSSAVPVVWSAGDLLSLRLSLVNCPAAVHSWTMKFA